jgi:hypothetical protein
MVGEGWSAMYAPIAGPEAIPEEASWVAKRPGKPLEQILSTVAATTPVWRRQLVLDPAPEICVGAGGAPRRRIYPRPDGNPHALFRPLGEKVHGGLGNRARLRHVHPLAAEGDALGEEQAFLPRTLGERAVGADDTPPGKVRLVGLEEDRAGEARRPGRDVAIAADETRGDLAHPLEHFLGPACPLPGQASGPKASMIRFWYSLSSSAEMK